MNRDDKEIRDAEGSDVVREFFEAQKHRLGAAEMMAQMRASKYDADRLREVERAADARIEALMEQRMELVELIRELLAHEAPQMIQTHREAWDDVRERFAKLKLETGL